VGVKAIELPNRSGVAKRLKIGVLDLAAREPSNKMWSRMMRANFASIMPQVVGVWAEEAGHDVHFVCYTGRENLLIALPDDIDVLFISAFTRSAHLAYAISNMYQKQGAITVLGGPHARCYPEDSQKYFDYVLGITDKALVVDLLQDCTRQRPEGVYLSALNQPRHLPGVEQRWKYISATLEKAPTRVKMVPMIGSLGCPYSCSFCIDSTIDYLPLGFDQIREDLKFIGQNMPNPMIGWYDPNFGVRFDEYMSVIEEAAPNASVPFIAESSLSLLSEKNVSRLGKAGCVAILPGVESWYGMGNKSGTGRDQGEEKVRQVSDHINMILRHIPYVQTNFVLGLDSDIGAEPFELTKKFIDLTPGAFPAYSLFSAFGEAAPMNADLQRDGRVIGFPHFFLDNNKSMNVQPMNYEWPEFYDHLIDLVKHSFSLKSVYRRFGATDRPLAKIINLVRAYSSEGYFRLQYHKNLRGLMETDSGLRGFLEQDTDVVPDFYTNRITKSLGDFAPFLPEGGMEHDPNAYSKKLGLEPALKIPAE
jgi:hypothetical protein